MKHFLKTALTGAACLLALAPVLAQKPVAHRFVAQDRGKVIIFSAKGDVEWEYDCPFTSHDIQALPSGNILVHSGSNRIDEVTPEKKIVWTHLSAPVAPYAGAVEIHGFRRLSNGLTMVAETGNLRIVEVDKEDKVVHSTPITVERPNSHRDTRNVRKLDNGNYLVAHEGEGKVREYDPSGKVVWEYALDLNGQPRTPNHDGHGVEVFGAVRLKNGNTLIAGGNNNRVIEVTPAGAIVWSIERDELPGIHLCWVTSLEVLPNGHIIVGNTHAGPENPQLFEVTRDKKVVWTVKNFDKLGNDMCAAQVLDVKGKMLR